MTDTRFPPYISATGRLIDPATIDLERAQQEGRRQRAIAFRSLLKSAYHGLFGEPGDRQKQKPVLAHDDCTAAA